MAVTFNSIPDTWSASGNPLTYEFSSTNYTQANFSMVVETYFNGTVVREERVFPEVTNGKAHIDIQETIDALLTNPTILPNLAQDSGTSGTIKVKVTEWYGTTPAAGSNATSTETNVFKCTLSDSDFTTIDFDSDWKQKKWFTNHPTKSVEVLRNQPVVINMLIDGAVSWTVTLLDSTGGTITSDTALVNHDILQMNLSKTALVAYGFSGTDVDNAASITVSVAGSDTFTLTYIDTDCINPYSVIWMNEYGAFDTFCFKHNDVRKGESEQKSFNKQFGAWNGTNFEYDPLNTGVTNYSSKQTNKGTLVSDYMTEEIHTWLTELYNTPYMLVYDQDGNARSINLVKRSWTYGQDKYEDLIMESLDYVERNIKRSVNL